MLDANGDIFNDKYKIECEGGLEVTATTCTDPDKRLFLKCISVIMEPRDRKNIETDGVVGSTVYYGIQPMADRSSMANEVASRNAGEDTIQ